MDLFLINVVRRALPKKVPARVRKFMVRANCLGISAPRTKLLPQQFIVIVIVRVVIVTVHHLNLRLFSRLFHLCFSPVNLAPWELLKSFEGAHVLSVELLQGYYTRLRCLLFYQDKLSDLAK